MQTRIINDIAYWTDGSRAAGQTVTFTLEGGSSFTQSELIFPKTVSVTTNHLGEFQATLWTNSEGETPTRWACTLPTGEVIRFVLEPGSTPISLRAMRVPGEAIKSGYQTLYGLFDTRYATKSELSAHTGTADPHPQYLTKAEGDASYAGVSHTHSEYASASHNHDGSYAPASHTSQIASATQLGHIKVGSGLNIDPDGVLSAVGGGGGGPYQTYINEGFIGGQLIIPGMLQSVTTADLNANQARFAPFVLRGTLTIDAMVCEVTTAASTAGAQGKMSLHYADMDPNTGTWILGNLIAAAGVVVIDSVGVKVGTFAAPITLGPGIYITSLNMTHSASYRSIKISMGYNFVSSSMGANPNFQGWRNTNVNFASSPAPAGTSLGSIVWGSTSVECFVVLRAIGSE